MEFYPGVFAPENLEGDSIWFAFHKGKLLMVQDQYGLMVPQLPRFDSLGVEFHQPHYLGEMAGNHCFTVALVSDENLPSNYFLHDLRRLAIEVDPALFMIAGRARQIIEWDHNHQFCGRCGSKTEHHDRDRAKLCPSCGHTQYPRISPCVIVLVTRGYEVLLARSPQFPKGMFSTLAGFVEPGETLEMAVHREVKEEVGVDLCNLRYMGSQPWPFPHSLMVGFHAEYKSGDIVLEDEEIEEAGWWLLDQLPNVPPQGSIARNLIDAYAEEMRS